MTQPDGLVYSYVHRINTMGGDMFNCTRCYILVCVGRCVCLREGVWGCVSVFVKGTTLSRQLISSISKALPHPLYQD